MTTLRPLVLLALATVSVANDPTLTLLPENIQKAVGADAFVSCTAAVDNAELVTEMRWTGPDGREIPNPEGTITVMDEEFSAGTLNLLIQNLRDEDTGKYECTAVYAGNQKLTASLMVDTFMDIDFGDTPEKQTPIAGTEAKIRCEPHAKPAPQVDWLKDRQPLKTDENHIIMQDGVLIKGVSEADEGVYTCRARVAELGSIKYKDIQVEVLIAPEITVAPEDLKGVELESGTLECQATGKPAPEYSWVNKDNVPLAGLEGYNVNAETGTLIIHELKSEHSGTYRCTAANPAGDASAEANLLVLTKPKVEQFLNISAVVGSEVELWCIVTGEPLPEVVFTKEGATPLQNGVNEDERVEVIQTLDDQNRRVGVLKLRGVERQDDGLYSCKASSEGGVTEAWGHITVEYIPTFEEQAQAEFWSWEQRVVNISCLATSIPNATIQWYLRNQLTDATDPNLQVMSHGPLGVLQVTPVTNQYYGTYTCAATNVHGVANMDVELKEAHVPGPIAQTKPVKKTATTITWDIMAPNSDGGLPVQGYRVEYRQQDAPWDDLTQSHFWTVGQTYTLDRLQPMETYVFRFSARNEVGEGAYGGEIVEEMPHIAQPEVPIIYDASDDVIAGIYPHEFSLNWQAPLDNGEPIDMYQIMYYRVTNTSEGWSTLGNKLEDAAEASAVSHKLEALVADATYKVELRAHNQIGYSLPAEIIVKTAEDPDSPPEVTQPEEVEAEGSESLESRLDEETTTNSAPEMTVAPDHGTKRLLCVSFSFITSFYVLHAKSASP